jgi:hypothetical protein
MFIHHGFGCFQFNDEFFCNEQVGEKLAQERAIFVVNMKRVLLLDRQTLFTETVREPVLIDFFGVAVTVVFVKGEAGFTDDITELVDGIEFHGETFCAFLCFSWPMVRQSAETTFSGWPPEQR